MKSIATIKSNGCIQFLQLRLKEFIPVYFVEDIKLCVLPSFFLLWSQGSDFSKICNSRTNILHMQC